MKRNSHFRRRPAFAGLSFLPDRSRPNKKITRCIAKGPMLLRHWAFAKCLHYSKVRPREMPHSSASCIMEGNIDIAMHELHHSRLGEAATKQTQEFYAMNDRQYFPALHCGKFSDPPAALVSIGFTADRARYYLSGHVLQAGEPLMFAASMPHPDSGADLQIEMETIVVLAMTMDGQTGLWFGLTEYMRNTEAGALEALVDDLIAHPQQDEAPTINMFEWIPIEETLSDAIRSSEVLND